MQICMACFCTDIHTSGKCILRDRAVLSEIEGESLGASLGIVLKAKGSGYLSKWGLFLDYENI